MTSDNCILTTKDFTILEIMRERCHGRDDPLAAILKQKLESATVMLRDDIPANVATLSSRVTFSVNGRHPDSRIISHDRMTSTGGMFLPITTARGLALIGLSEGQEFMITNFEGQEERILLHEVNYQPEAARRETQAVKRLNAPLARKPVLRVIRGDLSDQPRLAPVTHEDFDDPGPSAA